MGASQTKLMDPPVAYLAEVERPNMDQSSGGQNVHILLSFSESDY